MKELFYKISEDKRDAIILNSIYEFSNYYYHEASLNRIIKASNISKGGLFKYIDSKEDLYLHILEKELKRLINYQLENTNLETTDFFARIKELSIQSIDFYKENKATYKFILHALTDTTAPVYDKVINIKDEIVSQLQDEMLKNIDFDCYKIPKSEILIMYKFISDGVNQSINNDTCIEDIIRMLELILDALKYGIVK
ncbi:TetR/AcrR family transcriptional regulator [Vallitalea guaymasensis]|uniref:TetR/AcrR family transcriptional regulator n=2 Tax=Vallitalea guaymasensis TaxID=1185412 RepID=UPI00187D3BC8|nr:TetR/AcrR family transcriptional regulator [Vallitalea guaymasensis]